nr:hypothetical protein [Pandoravirus massiliensis]
MCSAETTRPRRGPTTTALFFRSTGFFAFGIGALWRLAKILQYTYIETRARCPFSFFFFLFFFGNGCVLLGALRAPPPPHGRLWSASGKEARRKKPRTRQSRDG